MKLITTMLLAVLLAGCATTGGRSRMADMAAANEVRQLAMACIIYANDHAGVLPAKLDALKDLDLIRDAGAYELVASGKLADIKDLATTVLVREKATASGGCQAVAYADGHIELVKNSPALTAPAVSR
ncbi:MAG: hypothetical protein NTY53_13585 [Kiritimatiellaeota bacterium]|nr:hypothetical protein [Kiritimatiellota bacterium]